MRHAAGFLIPVSLITIYYAFWVVLMAILLTRFSVINDFFPMGGLGDLAGRSDLEFEPIYQGALDTVWARFGAIKLASASLGALILIAPVSWAYFITSRAKEIDQSFAQTIIVMPIVVTGISMIAMNSIALAFSLAGIVAAVRFRFTLRKPSHAMYIFVAISVGLSAGVGALGIACVISASFVYTTLAIWKLEHGKTLSGPFLSMLTRRNRDEEI